MAQFKAKILGTGAALPRKMILSEDLEKELGYSQGTFKKASGVERRFRAEGETSSEMGAQAASRAISAAGIDPKDIDAIVSVSGVPQQAIPSTAALIHRHLGLKKTVAFDINATCLSFLKGFLCLSNLIDQGIYKHVLLVAADIATVGLDPKDPKTASLFGDGAAAVLLGPSDKAGILDYHFETNSELGTDCECLNGGNLSADGKLPREELYFKMNGPKLFRTAVPALKKMVKEFRKNLPENIDFYIPHQASPFALDLCRKKLGIASDHFMHIVRQYGNMIATSLPFALHQAIHQRRIKRGDRVMLFGTAAGLTVGGLVIEY